MAFYFSWILVAVMGFSIKLGNTCMVAASEQIIKHKNPTKLLHIVHSWLWIILLITALQIQGFNVPIISFRFSWMTVVGGLLLGWGAFKNKACAIGTISKIGDGNFNYLFSPLGMFFSVFIFYLLPFHHPQQITTSSIITQFPIAFFIFSIVAIVATLFFFWKKNPNQQSPVKHFIQPASIVAICFVLLLLNNISWSYTTLITDVAQNKLHIESNRILLFGIFFLSVILGGLYLKTFRLHAFDLKSALHCFWGGALIGLGSQCIIGSHDMITLYGFPLLLTSAVIAMLLNLLTIACCIKFSK